MEDAKDFVASMLKTVRDRLGNPLVSAFAIAWLIWNFRVVLVLVGTGDGGWRAKIDYLDKTLMVPSYMWGIHGLAVPLLFAVVWIFALPKLLRSVAIFHAHQSHITKEEMLEAGENEPISAAERTEMWAQMRKRQKSWDVERNELLKVIEDFQSKQQMSTLEPSPQAPDTPAQTEVVPPASTATDTPPEPNAPPFPPPLSHESIEIWKKSALLGFKLATQGDPINFQRPRIDFNDRVVVWPWTVSAQGAAAHGLNSHVASALKGVSFTESDLLVLGAMSDSPTGRSSAIRLPNFSDQMLHGILSKLKKLDMVRSIAHDYEIAPSGRLFLAWMARIGFEFQY